MRRARAIFRVDSELSKQGRVHELDNDKLGFLKAGLFGWAILVYKHLAWSTSATANETACEN